jgi:hypothetical protein
MKKMLKVFGVIALAAITGFSLIACGDDSGGGGGSDKYDAAMFEVSLTDFRTVFSTTDVSDSALEQGAIISETTSYTKSQMESKIQTLMASAGSVDGVQGISLSQVRQGFSEEVDDTDDVDTVINSLKKKGYVVAAVKYGSDVRVAAATKK